MFFILISVNIISYILCGEFIISGEYIYGLIAFLISLFISACIASLYIKKAQRISSINMSKSNPSSTLNMSKDDISQEKSNTFFMADCFDLGDCMDVPLMSGDCNCDGAEHGVLGIGDCRGVDCNIIDGIGDCSGADCDCGGADCAF